MSTQQNITSMAPADPKNNKSGPCAECSKLSSGLCAPCFTMVKKQEDKNSVGREHDNSRSPVAKQARREELPSGLLNMMTDGDDVEVSDSPSAVASQHDAIEKLRKVKQERQSPKLDPPTAAGECHSPLAQVPFFPKMNTSGSSAGGGVPVQPKPKYSNDDIMNKLSSMMTTM